MGSVACETDVIESALDRTPGATWAHANEKKAGRGGHIHDKRVRPVGGWLQASERRNRRDSNPLSPASSLLPAALLSSSLEITPTKQQHNGPPIPLFKIPPAEWPSVQRRIAQGESLRQIAGSYQVSYEAVRRVLKAARQEFLASEDEQVTKNTENIEQ